MAYEDDFERFRNAFAEVTAATVVLPEAAPIAAILGLIISDPAAMKKASQEWLSVATTSIDDQCPSSSSIKLLRESVRTMAVNAGKDKIWTGEAYQAFMGKVDLLDKSLDEIDRCGQGAGRTLDTSASVTHFLSWLVGAYALVIAMIAAYVLASTVYPPMHAQARVAASRAVIGLWKGLKEVFGSHTKFIWKASAVVAVAGAAFGQFTRMLPMMSALNQSAPNLIEAKAVWNPAELTIGDDPMPKMKAPDTSIVPEMGI
ncbi:hypothetical protein ACIBHY_38780 [Nonomuraea sp. NPDC050547]|uniref:hypothetical protein n=1 Tax=unclassified Nonomuraea TaxID=2593643 RepID=UPI0037997119